MRNQPYLILVTDAGGARNFLQTRFVDILLESAPVVVWHALPEEAIQQYRERWKQRVTWEAIPTVPDRPLGRWMRQSKIRAQLHWQRREDPDSAIVRDPPASRWQDQAMRFGAEIFGRLGAGPRRIRWLDDAHQHAASRGSGAVRLLESLRERNPSAVFCTHQRSLHAVPVLHLASVLGIPTATFIYSWDNVAKGRMPVRADNLLVWSELMKAEILQYYPDVDPERVWVVGTPQFESYFEPSRMQSRASFLRGLGLTPDRLVVCFSGDDYRTSPHDERYLEDVARACRENRGPAQPQLVFRSCPVDNEERYAKVLSEHPEVRVAKPLWRATKHEGGIWRLPLPEDASTLVNLAAHCDLVVNLGSTMAMDFAIHDKPAVFLAYEPVPITSRRQWSVRDVYRLAHFKKVHELDPVHWARSRKGLADIIGHALAHPGEKREARRRWLELEVAQPMNEASPRIASVLERIGRRDARASARDLAEPTRVAREDDGAESELSASVQSYSGRDLARWLRAPAIPARHTSGS